MLDWRTRIGWHLCRRKTAIGTEFWISVANRAILDLCLPFKACKEHGTVAWVGVVPIGFAFAARDSSFHENLLAAKRVLLDPSWGLLFARIYKYNHGMSNLAVVPLTGPKSNEQCCEERLTEMHIDNLRVSWLGKLED